MSQMISLNEQVLSIHLLLQNNWRQLTPIQRRRYEAAEQTLNGLMELRQRFARGNDHEDDPERITDEMAEELIDLLQLPRARRA